MFSVGRHLSAECFLNYLLDNNFEQSLIGATKFSSMALELLNDVSFSFDFHLIWLQKLHKISIWPLNQLILETKMSIYSTPPPLQTCLNQSMTSQGPPKFLQLRICHPVYFSHFQLPTSMLSQKENLILSASFPYLSQKLYQGQPVKLLVTLST